MSRQEERDRIRKSQILVSVPASTRNHRRSRKLREQYAKDKKLDKVPTADGFIVPEPLRAGDLKRRVQDIKDLEADRAKRDVESPVVDPSEHLRGQNKVGGVLDDANFVDQAEKDAAFVQGRCGKPSGNKLGPLTTMAMDALHADLDELEGLIAEQDMDVAIDEAGGDLFEALFIESGLRTTR